MDVRARATGDTAAIEITFDASPGQTYTFTQLVGIVPSTEKQHPARRRDPARPGGGIARVRQPRGRQRPRVGAALGDRHRPRRRPRAAAGRPLDAVLPALQRGLGHRRWASRRWGSRAPGYYGHVFWDSDTWMFPALPAHPSRRRPLDGRRSGRARCRPPRPTRAPTATAGRMYPWEADERGEETTPHFAAQNASSEIHVNGDVALAQWQYYLATGDSSLARARGVPGASAGTADFWVSRAAYDSAGGAVPYPEGRLGGRGAGRRGRRRVHQRRRPPQPGDRHGRRAPARPTGRPALGTVVAARLHLPIDSASGSFRTYEGAPDSTLGVITPLLTYPLGVPMSDADQADAPRAGGAAAGGRGRGSDDGHHPALGGRRGAGRPPAGRLAPAVQLPGPPARPVPHALGDARPTPRSAS